MKNKAKWIGLSTLIGIMTIGSAALAESTKQAQEGYTYEFKDDTMQAEGMGAHTAQIRVIKVGRRDLLLRPRVQFVTEMLKSIEAL